MNKIEELEKRLERIERLLGLGPEGPAFPMMPNVWPGKTCTCPPGTVCGNVACPMRPQITSAVAPNPNGFYAEALAAPYRQ